MHIFARMFEKEIEEYERVREVYQKKVAEKMNPRDWMDYNEILFSAHSCAIEGNSFTVDDNLVAFFFRVAINRMNDELLQKERNSRHAFLF